MKPSLKVAVVAGGYIVAFLMASAVVAIRVANTSGPDAQASSGMYTFGDALHLQGWAASLADLRKVELLVRDSNVGAIGLYQRLGFVEEGRFRGRIGLPDGTFVDDVAMAWFPPRKGCR